MRLTTSVFDSSKTFFGRLNTTGTTEENQAKSKQRSNEKKIVFSIDGFCFPVDQLNKLTAYTSEVKRTKKKTAHQINECAEIKFRQKQKKERSPNKSNAKKMRRERKIFNKNSKYHRRR